jgi:hypothetical protein
MKASTLTTILLLVTMTSCHFNSQYVNREEDKKEGEMVTSKLSELLKAKDYEATKTLFSEKFFEVTDKEKLFKIFTMTTENLGDLQTTEIEAWETRRVEGSDPSANYAFVYKNTYDKFPAKETIRLMREEDGQIRIISYNINSDGLMNI